MRSLKCIFPVDEVYIKFQLNVAIFHALRKELKWTENIFALQSMAHCHQKLGQSRYILYFGIQYHTSISSSSLMPHLPYIYMHSSMSKMLLSQFSINIVQYDLSLMLGKENSQPLFFSVCMINLTAHKLIDLTRILKFLYSWLQSWLQ